MKQIFLNDTEDCTWLRETHLKLSNLNNTNPIPDFKSFCLFGNEDCPQEILLYAIDFAESILEDSNCHKEVEALKHS